MNDIKAAADNPPKTASAVNTEPQSGSGCGKIFVWGLIAILAILLGRGFLVYNGTWSRIEERFAGATEEQPEETAPPVDPFDKGIEYATNASTLAQTAESQDEWQRTSNLWNAAAEQMKAVPADSSNNAIAQQKVTEYEKNRQYAADRVAALEAQRQQAKAWYEGGTLHNASALDWQQASYENKLATCADFIAAARQEGLLAPQTAYKSSTPEGLRALSEDLVAAMDIAMAKESNSQLNEQMYANETVSGMATGIITLSDWAR